MDSALPEIERGVAGELNHTLRNRRLWAALESPYSDAWQRDAMVKQALRLYRLTSPIIVARVDDVAGPVDHAAGVLRDFADACAIFVRRWSDPEQALLQVPDRSEVEARVVSLGLPEWAASLDVDLPFSGVGGRPARGGLGREGNPEEGSPEELAASWGRMVDTFRKAAIGRATNHRTGELEGDDIRDGASGLVALARAWMMWVRKFHGANLEVIAVAVTQLFAAQGFFAVTWDKDRCNLFPDDEYLRRFLELTGGLDWLTSHGAKIPEQLQTP